MKSAYGRQTLAPDYELTCVEPGSPMGELLRRYWQPVCKSDELRDLPKKVKLLCEEPVVFRDKKGCVGALEPHCSHRAGALSHLLRHQYGSAGARPGAEAHRRHYAPRQRRRL